MKKNYLAPTLEAANVELEQGIAVSGYQVGVQDFLYDGEEEYLM